MPAGCLGRAFPGSSRLGSRCQGSCGGICSLSEQGDTPASLGAAFPHLGACAGGAGAKLAEPSSPGGLRGEFCVPALAPCAPAPGDAWLGKAGRGGMGWVRSPAAPPGTPSPDGRGEFSSFPKNGCGGSAGSGAHANGSLLNRKWLCYALDLLEAEGLIS